MQTSKDFWQVGEGSYILNPEATIDILLHDAAEWMRQSIRLSELLGEFASRGETHHVKRVKETLESMRIFSFMSLQCVRLARTRVVLLHDMPPEVQPP